MALLGNGFRDISLFPGRYVGAFSGVASPSNLRTMFGRGNRMAQSSHFGDLAGTPDGAEHPTAWILPMQGGAMVADTTLNQDNATTNFVQLGANMAASLAQDASITAAALSMITSLSANLEQAGQLTGPMQMTLNLASEMAQAGEITAAMGLIAWCQAELAQSNDISTSNLRGEMNMAASIVSYGELTPEGLRDAVWSAVASQYNTSGTMGNKLNSAASGGVDYTALGVAVWASVSRTLTDGTAPDTTAIAAAVLAALNATTIPVDMQKVRGQTLAGSGSEADPWGP